MSDFLPIAGCFGLVFFVLPIVAIIVARKAANEARDLRARMSELSARISQLEPRRSRPASEGYPTADAAPPPAAAPSMSTRDVLPMPPNADARPPGAPSTPTSGVFPGVMPPPPAVSAGSPPLPGLPLVPPQFPPPEASHPFETETSASVPGSAPPAPPVAPARAFDWESFISVRAFAWLGGAALFLGMGLFLQYSIQHNLISPAARVAIGLLVGAGALAGGDVLRRKGDWAGQAMSGAGVAILYASLFAAHSRYALLGSEATFAGMAFVTIVAGLLASRRRVFAVAVLGLVGGFLTPWLLATNEDHPIALFAYVMLLDAGAIAVARRRNWISLQFIGLAGTGILFAGWSEKHLDAAKAPFALSAAAILGALFAAGAYLRLRRETAAAPAGAVAEHGRDFQAYDEGERIVPILGVLGPLLAAVVIAGTPALSISPAFLAVYLLAVSGGAFLVARESGFTPLLPIAAGFCVAAQAFRISPGLVAGGNATLLLFSLVPAGFVALALWTREGTGAPSPASAAEAPPGPVSPSAASMTATRAAAAIVLAGSFAVSVQYLEKAASPPSAWPLFAYGAAHALGLLAIATALASGVWIVSAQGLMFVHLIALVASTRLEPARLPEFLPLILAPAILFWALPFLSPRWRRDRVAWLSSALAPLMHYPLLYVFAKPVWGTTMLGGVAILFAAAALFALQRSSALLTDPEDRRFTAALFGAVTLLFVTAAIPIVLEKQWITVAWALESAALAWLWRRVPEPGLVKASTALAAAAFARLLMNPALWEYYPRSGTPIFNWYLYTFAIPAVAMLVTARLLAGSEWAERSRVPPLLQAAGGVLLFVLLNVEIADFYSTGTSLAFHLTGGGLAQDMTYSLAWGVFALILLGLGLARGSKPTRAAALAVLLLTIGKVFLHDLWNLGALYRVGSIVGLAVALLAVSFLTQRFVFPKEKS